jgi:hypothetical protein
LQVPVVAGLVGLVTRAFLAVFTIAAQARPIGSPNGSAGCS